MKQDRDVRNWIDCNKVWQDQGRKIKELGSAGFWNKNWKLRSDHVREKRDPGTKKRLIEELFGMLDEAGFHAGGARVLDVGCGLGALTLPLARAGARVTSLDISGQALRHVAAEADREGLSIEPVECSWWTADIDSLGFRNRFDLVIGSMTPAIKDLPTFDRMMACSRNYCYYSGSLWGMNRAHQQILKKILGTDSLHRPTGTSRFMYHFMYLYLNGYRPLVRINHTQHRMEVDWEEAADRMICSLDHDVPCTGATKRKIRAYFKKSAVDGKYTLRSGGYTGMMVWDVNP